MKNITIIRFLKTLNLSKKKERKRKRKKRKEKQTQNLSNRTFYRTKLLRHATALITLQDTSSWIHATSTISRPVRVYVTSIHHRLRMANGKLWMRIRCSAVWPPYSTPSTMVMGMGDKNLTTRSW